MTGQASAYCRAILAAALCAVAVGFGGGADAAPGSLREGLFRRHPSDGRPAQAPPVARYVSEDGQVFIFDRSQPRPLLRFEGSPEIWALHPQPAPRGDVIYKNDVGEPVIRATRLGGLTVFTPDRPEGAAAASTGDGPPIRLPPIGPQALIERMAQSSARASRAARRLIPFEAEATPESSALLADAAVVTSEAVIRMSRQPRGRAMIARIQKIELSAGRRAEAELDEDGVLHITVAPQQGLAGRPSSERIVRVAAER